MKNLPSNMASTLRLVSSISHVLVSNYLILSDDKVIQSVKSHDIRCSLMIRYPIDFTGSTLIGHSKDIKSPVFRN